MSDGNRGRDGRGRHPGSDGSLTAEEMSHLRTALQERIEFIEDMSHELRSGLTFIRGYVDLFLGGSLGPINDRQQHALQVMERRTEGVVHLLDQMLSLERARSGHLELNECVDVSEIVHHSVQNAALAADKAGVRILAQAEPATVALADPRRLVQVMDNLVSNAIKFSYSGGSVVIKVTETDADVIVRVKDDGVGIAPEEQERVFERFYRTRQGADRAAGSGLGLVITKAIIEAHGGSIWVESALGKGTAFIFSLPKSGPTASALHV
ncbi:MAG: sensor histidine kinase [Anaerolineae bacterium]